MSARTLLTPVLIASVAACSGAVASGPESDAAGDREPADAAAGMDGGGDAPADSTVPSDGTTDTGVDVGAGDASDASVDSTAASDVIIDVGDTYVPDAPADMVLDGPADAAADADGCPPGDVVCQFNGCTDLQTDPNNCGACNKGCPLGASCQMGTCQCPAGQVVCPLDGCVDLQTNEANCGSCGNACSLGNGQGYGPDGYCELGACHVPVLLAATANPQAITIDTDNVYVTSNTDTDAGAVVVSVPKDGGVSTTLASNTSITFGAQGIAVDSANVYWGGNAGLMSAPKAGGPTRTLASASISNPVWGVAVDANNVYWSTFSRPGTVMSVPIRGGTPTTLASGRSEPAGIVVTGTNVIWGEAWGSVWTAPIDGGAVTSLAPASQPLWLALDSTNVYWMGNGGGVVGTVPIGGGTWTSLATINPPYEAGVAVDGTRVYAGTQGLTCMDKSTGSNLFVISSQAFPIGIAVDSTSVYWTDHNSGGPWKIDKP